MRLRNKDIAKKMGISPTAGSLALNNKPGVSEDTRQKIMAMVRENAEQTCSECRPASVQPAHRGTMLLSIHNRDGHVINDKPYFSDLVATAQQEAMRQNYSLLLANYMPGQDLSEYIRYLATLPVAGLIILATELLEEDFKQYQKLNLPMVLLDASIDMAEIDSVELDNQMAMYRATDYAIRMGHRDIGYLQGEPFILNFGHHQDGFWNCLRRHQLLDAEHPVLTLPCTIDGAYHKMKEFLINIPEGFKYPTLYNAELDNLALGAMKALKDSG